MALLADRVKETTTTTGTGTVSLAGAPAGFQSFNTAFANGSLVYYVIQGGAEWEIGIGTTGTGTLARTQVLQSSNADALVPFSAGVKDVFCSYVADRAVTTVDAATLTNKTIDDYTNSVGANKTHFRIKATGTISKGSVVKATGYNPGEMAIEVAVVTSATDLVLGISEQALTAGQFGMAVVIGELFDVNTNGFTVGNIIYSNGAGGFTETKPSSGLYQALGWIVRANASNGVIAVNVVAPLYVETATNTANTSVLRDGSGNFAAGTITATLSGTATQVSQALTAGSYLTSTGTYNGSTARTFAVDATDANTASKVVARDGSGNFSAGTITATLNGAAPAGSLSGTTLASGVTASSLTSVGTLSSLTVSGNTYVATTSGNLGIGTASPSRKLTVNGGAAGSDPSVYVYANTYATIGVARGANTASAGVNYYNATPTQKWFTGIYENSDNFGFYNAGFGGFPLVISDTTGNAAFDTNTLYVDAANNRVGVGTASPLYNLDVYGGASGVRTDIYARNAAANFSAGVLTDNNGYTATTNAWILYTAAAERLRVDASGNLGLGVTPSAWWSGVTALQVRGASLISSDNTATVSANAYLDSGIAWRYRNSTYATSYEQTSGTHAWFTAPSGTAGNAITFTQAMTLNANGQLSVGTTAGNYRLRVASADNSGSTVISRFESLNELQAVQIRFASVLGDGGDFTTGTSTNHATVFVTNNTERARIDTSGNLGVGTTSPTFSYGSGVKIERAGISTLRIQNTTGANDFELYVDSAANGVNFRGYASSPLRFYTADTERARITSGGYTKASSSGSYYNSTGTFHEMLQSAGDTTAYFVNTASSGAEGIVIRYNNQAPNGTGNIFLNCVDSTAGGTQRAAIRSNGGLANYQSNNVDLSDARTKTNITPAASMWSKIGALEIVTYKYTDQTHDDVNVGVIAQQVEAVEPVWVDADGFGETPADGVPLKTVYTKDITFAAIKALQEAMARIETLEQRVLALEA